MLEESRAEYFSAIIFIVFGWVRLHHLIILIIFIIFIVFIVFQSRNYGRCPAISRCAQTSPAMLLFTSGRVNSEVHGKTWHGPVKVGDIKPIT